MSTLTNTNYLVLLQNRTMRQRANELRRWHASAARAETPVSFYLAHIPLALDVIFHMPALCHPR